MGLVQSLRKLVALAGRWLSFMHQRTAENGIDGLAHGLAFTRGRTLSMLSRFIVREVHNPGTPIWEKEWDVLLILDACRVDLMRDVAPSHDAIGGSENVGTFWSQGSKSSDWLRRTFTEEYRDAIERTAYVTGNPFTSEAELGDDSSVITEAERTGNPDIAERNRREYGWSDSIAIRVVALLVFRAGQSMTPIISVDSHHQPPGFWKIGPFCQ